MAFGRKTIGFTAASFAALGFATLPSATEFAFGATLEEPEATLASDPVEIDASLFTVVEDEEQSAKIEALTAKQQDKLVEAEEEAKQAAEAAAQAEQEAEAAADKLAAQQVDGELLCLAKIIHHESANQPREGQLAVGQVVMNRVKSARFPNSICGVATQRGQFFNVHAYNPSNDHRWPTSIEIAKDARAGISGPVVGQAVFFQATWGNSSFFRSRPLVRRIGGHNFYR